MTKAKAEKGTEVEVYEGRFRILASDDDSMAEILAENFVGDDGFTAADLTRVRFPREGDAWQFEDAGVKRIEQELVGVPVRQQVSRTFYLTGYEEGSNDAPDCRSNDGITGFPKTDEDGRELNLIYASSGEEIVYGGACAKCPLNQWESAQRIGKQGKGKACTEYRTIALLEPEAEWPLMVRLPPTQIRNWVEFTKGLTRRRLRISDVVVALKIEDGELTPRVEARLDPETAVELRSSVNGLLSVAHTESPALPSAEPPPPDDEMGPF